jgi:hypothetical protein
MARGHAFPDHLLATCQPQFWQAKAVAHCAVCQCWVRDGAYCITQPWLAVPELTRSAGINLNQQG